MKKYPKISVITPVYNRQDLVSETIDSVLNQNYPNLEYLVLDDGSTDETFKVLKKYSKKITLMRQKNLGETRSVNKLLNLAKGKYIIYLGSDDLLIPGSLKYSAKFMEKHPEALVGYGDTININAEGKILGKSTSHKYDYEYMFTRYHCIVTYGWIMRRDGLKYVNRRNEKFRYVADFEYWLKLGLYGDFIRIPKFLVKCRIFPGAQSFYAKGDKMARENIKVVEEIVNLPKFPSDLRKKKNLALSSASFHAAYNSVGISAKSKYYLDSIKYSPKIFAEKLKYELVKLKHFLSSILLSKAY